MVVLVGPYSHIYQQQSCTKYQSRPVSEQQVVSRALKRPTSKPENFARVPTTHQWKERATRPSHGAPQGLGWAHGQEQSRAPFVFLGRNSRTQPLWDT